MKTRVLFFAGAAFMLTAVAIPETMAAPHGHHHHKGNDGLYLAGGIVRLVNTLFAPPRPVVLAQPAVVEEVVPAPVVVRQVAVVPPPPVVVYHPRPAVRPAPPRRPHHPAPAPHHRNGHGRPHGPRR